jgi:hypothetical protein
MRTITCVRARQAAHPLSPVHHEFQNFGTRVISTILSDSGKEELWLTLAHQFIAQLDEEVRNSVLANCTTIVSFRLGPDDAPIIAKAIDWNADDLRDLPRGKARVRTLLDGQLRRLSCSKPKRPSHDRPPRGQYPAHAAAIRPA